MCRHFGEDFGLTTRVARYHNVYGPFGTYEGGREKAPAAISRKVIEAQISGNHEITIWGDGKQTRSFMHIDDCMEGTFKIMYSDIEEPINLGSSEMVSINELVDIVEDIAGVQLNKTYDLDAPKGVRGRNSDNTLIKKHLDWEPSIALRDGMRETYKWIKMRMTESE
jgi:nucleoside-diphosphate-sugar epimerase